MHIPVHRPESKQIMLLVFNVLDAHFARMNGLEVLRQLNQIRPHYP